MTLSGTTALIFALAVSAAPPAADFRAAGVTTGAEAPVEVARPRRLQKCTKVKRAPCEMLLPEEESSDIV